MFHRVDTFIRVTVQLLCTTLLLFLASCSSDDGSGERLVTFTLSTGHAASLQSRASSDGNGDVASGVADANDKDWYVKDVIVYIFDESGIAIGNDEGTFHVSDNKTLQISVSTRQAQGCTVYAVANAATLNGGVSPFAGVSTLSEFKSKYKTFSTAAELESASCLLMEGSVSGFDTSTGSASISLERLASRLDFNISVKNDDAIGCPIVVDSYQLCHVPQSSLYVQNDFLHLALPSSGTAYLDLSEQTSAIHSWDASPSAAYTAYSYANPSVSADDATYLLIKAHAQVSSTVTSKMWEGEFKVYIQGISGLSDYVLLPNYHYTINITIQGASTASNGVIVKVDASPILSFSPSLKDWEDKNENTDLDTEN